ncbi:MAG: hypothetical protein ACRDZ8_05975, partial [Acidimicrobiales bacterium]
RQRAAAQAAARHAWGDASWAEYRAGETYREAERDKAVRDRWLADNAIPLTRHRQLSRQADQARAALQAAAVADPAEHHVAALGPPPLTGPGRRRWAQAAADLDAYRQRWRIEGPDPLGPQPANPDQARQHDRLRGMLDATRRHLQQGRDRGRNRDVDMGMGL